MFSFLQRYRDLLVISALLIIPLGGYLTSGHRGRAPNFADRAVLALASPVQSLLTWSLAGVATAIEGYVALRGAHEEAAELRARLAAAHEELNALKEAQAENVRLRAALRYVEGSVEEEIVARVVGLNPSPQFQSLRIDRGEDHGVRVGMPVATPDGVVGQVVRAVGGSADVLLLTDPASRLGGVVQRSRVRATVSGTGDGRRLSVDLVRREDDLVDGDVVVTAGSDGIFPRGVPLGTVRSVSRPSVGMFLQATVVPAVDLARVEEVVVLPMVLTLPPPPAAPAKEGAR